ncbi:hypothetical protein SAMN05720764_10768 [Fibrobacter sp. UWH5]|uniref:hypothetical protein n=1 Tax=Fibrobacter sp. UWH5 TaxID=1896211 RepID=UPI0009165D6B|nr:hypothetical protein [Fibrobacter sp. UWH5]SHL07106.1 hypothetical protein SAMN05720764_10768 [Fibrobacter sp. UWH5]
MSTDQGFNILSKACNQWIAKVSEKKDQDNPFSYQILNYKGTILFESIGFKKKADCINDIWRMRDEIITNSNDLVINGQKLSNKLLKNLRAIDQITLRRRLLNTKEVKITPPKAKFNQLAKPLLTETIGKKKVLKVADELFSTATINRKPLKVIGKEIYAQSGKLFGNLQGSDSDDKLKDEFISIIREKGQVVDTAASTKTRKSPITPKIIDYMYSLDGREPNTSANPTEYKQWENQEFVFWRNEKLREFFKKFIVGEKNEK